MLWIFRMPWLVLLFTSLSQSGSHPVVLLMMSHQLSLKWALHKCTYLPWFPLFCSEDWVSKCVRMAGSERTVKHFFVFFSQLCLSGLIGERRANPYPGSLWLPEYQWTHLPSWQPPTPGRARRPVWETAYSYLKHIVWSLKCFSLPDHVFKTIAVETLVREGTIFEKLGVIHHRYIFVNPWPYS